MLLGVQLIEV
uniref:Uncharacterized protein n=1 Tax=Arundo donax TaxID=35708 RepID=A0A0A9HPT3_ARUDO